MVKKRQKNNFTVILWIVILSVFVSATGGCSKERDWVSIGELSDDTQMLNVEADEDSQVPGNDQEQEDNTSQSSLAVIKVYVCGAVVNPGVVSVPSGSRVETVLEAAGGFAGNAAKDKVNLAAWVTDGQMVYFPAEGESYSDASGSGGDGLVNINSANVEELCTLPGIGESRAVDIIGYREKNGEFTCREEIMEVAGIKDAVYEKIKDKITVN